MNLVESTSQHFRLSANATSRSCIGLTNRELAQAFRAGRREVFEQLYWQHVGDVERLVRAALRRARQFSLADASDVVQDVFVKAFSSGARATYDGVREYGPFLQRIASNTVIDWLRRKRYRAARTLELVRMLDEPVLKSEFEEDPFSSELLAAAERYVVGLDPDLKAVHARRFLAAESQEVAARKLGISRQNLRTLERRLLAGLRQEISVVSRS